MIRTILICSIIFFVTSTEYASAKVGDLRVGVEGGPTMTWFRTNEAFSKKKYEKEHLNSFFGISGELLFTKNFSIFSSLTYGIKSMEGKFSESGNTNFLEMGALMHTLNIRASFGHKIKFYMEGGMFWGLITSPEWTVKERYGNEHKQKIDFKSTDSGINLGTGICFESNDRIAVNLGIRYNIGMKEIVALEPIYCIEYSFQSRSLAAVLGVSYRIDY
jgi:opacity protein-like surface antigen